MIPEPFLKDLEEVTLPKGITPLIIDRESSPLRCIFSLYCKRAEAHFSSTPHHLSPTKEANEMLNQIYLKAYGEPALYLAQDIPTLLEALPKAHKIEKSLYRYTPKPNELRRKTFGERLRYIIKEQELGQSLVEISSAMERLKWIKRSAPSASLAWELAMSMPSPPTPMSSP
ncbi:Uncharacterised protein [Wolinella succinogenes]|uniref:hypothetical protein n=1 Tax=Wolinella succinogenes TaxID=844 RepID=UPI000F6F4C81|nr:hypothetical protein [Wolinella succinogenes]VEG82467.1 Uncharacterised protein [Wolinella succinogenes]